MRHGLLVLLLGGLVAGGFAGCQAPLGSAFGTSPSAGIAAAAADVDADRIEMVKVRADTPRVTRTVWVQDVGESAARPVVKEPGYVRRAEGSPAPAYPPAFAAPCAPPSLRDVGVDLRGLPCGPKCWSGCGLPCAEGFSDWHVRGVVGYAFQAGTETGASKIYWGVDLGWTSKCCWGVDAFYRSVPCTTFDRRFPVVGAAPLLGEDGCSFSFVGVKATYQRSFGKSRLYWYAGVGPQYFWTGKAIDNDSGWGGFGELGVGYVISKNWRIRAAVEAIGVSTSAARLNPVDDSSTRMLWFVAPVVQVEFSL